MGRTNGRLIPFLKESLEKKRYSNLAYEDEEEVVFYIQLPRAGTEANSDNASERILKDWYKVNKNPNYVNYSGGKTVFQAALKKSIYLVTLPRNGTKKRFRYSTPDETKEKKERQKRLTTPESNPPSVCSSGYHSSSDDMISESLEEHGDIPSEQGSEGATSETEYHGGSEDFNFSELSMELNSVINQENTELDFDFLDSIINENSTIWDAPTFKAVVTDLLEGDSVIMPNNNEDCMSMDHNLFGVSNIVSAKDKFESLKELAVPVQQNTNLQPKIWVCTKKANIDTFVVLICESVMIQSDNAEIEQIIIPNCMLESRQLSLQKSFILLEKLFMIFI